MESVNEDSALLYYNWICQRPTQSKGRDGATLIRRPPVRTHTRTLRYTQRFRRAQGLAFKKLCGTRRLVTQIDVRHDDGGKTKIKGEKKKNTEKEDIFPPPDWMGQSRMWVGRPICRSIVQSRLHVVDVFGLYGPLMDGRNFSDPSSRIKTKFKEKRIERK